jgi:hypothetical protein
VAAFFDGCQVQPDVSIIEVIIGRAADTIRKSPASSDDRAQSDM